MTVLHFCLLPSANIVLFFEFNKSVINKFVKWGGEIGCSCDVVQLREVCDNNCCRYAYQCLARDVRFGYYTFLI